MQDSLLDNFAPLWVRRSLFGQSDHIARTRRLKTPAFYSLGVSNLEKSLARTLQHCFFSPHAVDLDLGKLLAQNHARAPLYACLRISIPPAVATETKEEKPFYKSALVLDPYTGNTNNVRPFAQAYASLGVVLVLFIYADIPQIRQSRVLERLLSEHSDLKAFAAIASSLVFWSVLATSGHEEKSGADVSEVLALMRQRYEELFASLTTWYEAECNEDVEQLNGSFSRNMTLTGNAQLAILSAALGSVKHNDAKRDASYVTRVMRGIAFYVLRKVLVHYPCLFSALRGHSVAYENFMQNNFGGILPPRFRFPVTPSVFVSHAASDTLLSPEMSAPRAVAELMGDHIADFYNLSPQTASDTLKAGAVQAIRPLLRAMGAFNVPYTSAMFWMELQLVQSFYVELLRRAAGYSEVAESGRLLVSPELVRYLFCFRVYGPRHEKTKSRWSSVSAEIQNVFLLLSVVFASRLRFAVLPLEHVARVNNGVSTILKMRDFLGEPPLNAGLGEAWYSASAMSSLPTGGDVLVYCPRCPRVASLVFSPMSVLGPAAAASSSASSSSSATKAAFPGMTLKGTNARLDLVGAIRGLAETKHEEGVPDSVEGRAAMVSRVAYEHLYCPSKRRNKRGSNALCVEQPLCVVSLKGAIAYVDTEAFLLCQNPECGVITKLSDVNRLGVYVDLIYCAACTKKLVFGKAVCRNPACAEEEMPSDVSHKSVKQLRLYCDACTHRVQTADWHLCSGPACRERVALKSQSNESTTSFFCSDACEKESEKDKKKKKTKNNTHKKH